MALQVAGFKKDVKLRLGWRGNLERMVHDFPAETLHGASA